MASESAVPPPNSHPSSSSSSSSPPSTTATTTSQLKFADVGINLTDPVFQGSYHSKQAHPPDLAQVLARAQKVGCQKFMVTGSSLQESRSAIELAKQYPGQLYATVGVHPCSAQQLFPSSTSPSSAPNASKTKEQEEEEAAAAAEATSQQLTALAALATQGLASGHVVAFGEIGLDYDRLTLCPRETQLRAFTAQLDLAVQLQLPLFLHSRACAADFEQLLLPRLAHLPRRGLVHSFTGTRDEMLRLLAMGFHIGVNGCSLKTPENVAVVAAIPLDRLQIETDGPWCEMRASHASAGFLAGAPALPTAVKKERWTEGTMVKGRNEPCAIVRVAWAVARIKGVALEVVCEAAWRNSVRMFGLGEVVE